MLLAKEPPNCSPGMHMVAAGCGKAVAAKLTAADTPAGSGEGGKASSASTDDVELGVVERSEQPTIKLEVAAAEQQHLPAAADALSDYFNAAAAALPSSLPPAAPTTSSPLATDSEDGEALRVTIDSKERLRWSPQLHQRFCKAVAELGGSAVAKPKDIVTKMGVPGLTLAHVKSHLQKHRQQEGVTYVPHSTRNSPAATRRFHSQQHAAAAQPRGWPAAGRSGSSSDSEEPPAAKRARTASRGASPASGDASAGGQWAQQPRQPLGAVVGGDGGAAGMPMASSAAATASSADPFLHYLQALASVPAAQPQEAPPPLPVPLESAAEQDDGGLHRLHALAELASTQYDELMAERRALEGQAATLGALAERLAAPPHQAQWAAQAPGLHATVGPLLLRQAQVQEAVREHMRRGALLMEEVRAFQRAAQEQLAQQVQQGPGAMSMVAAAMAALRGAAEQRGGPAVGQPGVPPSLATQLLAVMAAAGVGAAPGVVPPAPQPAPNAAGAAAGLAQLQHLYQSAAMLAARQQA